MIKKIQCKINKTIGSRNVKIKILKAPFVDTGELKKVVFARSNALVL